MSRNKNFKLGDGSLSDFFLIIEKAGFIFVISKTLVLLIHVVAVAIGLRSESRTKARGWSAEKAAQFFLQIGEAKAGQLSRIERREVSRIR